MIISHKYKFIFIKTSKTAGTSIEVYLSAICGEEDILTPVIPGIRGHTPRNYKGLFNPFPELLGRYRRRRDIIKDALRFNKFYNHIPAILVKERIKLTIWNNYYKFAVERNPWDKTLSHYYMLKTLSNKELTLEDYFLRGRFCKNYPMYTDKLGNMMVDEVIKYEFLMKDLTRIFDKLGIPFSGKLGVQAKSEYRKNKKTYNQVLSKRNIELINSVFSDEIKMHGYQAEV